MESNIYQLEGVYFFIMLVTSAISLLLIRYTLTLRRYLKQFTEVSKRVSNKEFHSRVDESAKGELGELSKNFNSMIETMDKTIEEVKYKHLQLTSIVKSVSHGILAIDIKGNILLINDIAKDMIKSKSQTGLEGCHLRKAINDEKILNVLQKNIGNNKNIIVDLNLENNIVYRIKIDPVYLQDTKHVIMGSIINIEDITEIVRLENMRKDFVANVSHELKTPLTSIMGFVETLKMNENLDVDTRNHFLDIIEKESNRLTALIEDILLLSSIENGENEYVEDVKLSQVFKEVYEITNIIARDKNIDINYNFEDDDIHIKGRRDNIKQIFLNLVDNGIKYTPNSGSINVKQYCKDNNIIMEFKDNGIGIPQEDLSRVFERFYRVDKARSRDVGGTGLGLAITKHMIKTLGGNITVESELSKGSTFIITIPIN